MKNTTTTVATTRDDSDILAIAAMIREKLRHRLENFNGTSTELLELTGVLKILCEIYRDKSD